MIEERFLESAIRIRKSFLKTSTNLDMYHRKAKNIIQGLEDIVEKVNKLMGEIEQDRKSGNPVHTKETALEEMMKILKDLEEQGKVLEDLADPVNSDIEKLAMEEQELYRQIKEKHSNISDEQLLNIVKERLLREGLS